MSEEITNTSVETMDNDYIETINQLKANSVSKADYDKLLRENRQLLNNLANGTTPEVAKPVEKKDIVKMRDELVYGEYSNLEYATRALELRDEMMAQGYEDPFLPQGKQVAATEDDIKAAQRVADGLRHCIDYANGDRQLFTNELQRITRDVVPMAGRRK